MALRAAEARDAAVVLARAGEGVVAARRAGRLWARPLERAGLAALVRAAGRARGVVAEGGVDGGVAGVAATLAVSAADAGAADAGAPGVGVAGVGAGAEGVAELESVMGRGAGVTGVVLAAADTPAAALAWRRVRVRRGEELAMAGREREDRCGVAGGMGDRLTVRFPEIDDSTDG